MRKFTVSTLSLFCLVVFTSLGLGAEYFVAPGGTGTGTSASPLGSIQAGINLAQAGDFVTVKAGTYAELLTTKRNGLSGAPITIRSQGGRGTVIVTRSGRLMNIAHAFQVVDGFVFDGKYVYDDLIRVESSADDLIFRNNEVRNATKDCMDMGGPERVLVDNCLIHHSLNAAGGRTDAHGIVAGPVYALTVRNTEIHSFSGDALQLDPNRDLPGWDHVTIEGCKFWLQPLPAAVNGFAAGITPGENALDTKTNPNTGFRATLTIKNTVAYGFRNGLIGNMAAFNLKENISATLDRVTVYDSEIAFRCRGPGVNGGSNSTIKNAVVYNTKKGVRYEDNVTKAWFFNSTFGRNVTYPLEAASSTKTGVLLKNCLFLRASLPTEAPAANKNLAVTTSVFVNSAADDYHLLAGTAAVDTGLILADVTTDRDGIARPQGSAHDMGAYERTAGVALAAPSSLVLARHATYPQSRIILTWKDNSSTETRFYIEQSVDGVNFTQIKYVNTNVTTYTKTSLSANKKYYYRVRAFDGTRYSAYSNTANLTTAP